MKKNMWIAFLVGIMLWLSPNAEAIVVDLPVIEDDYVFSLTPGNNPGYPEQLLAGETAYPYSLYAYLKFNLTSIPDTASLNSAIVYLYGTTPVGASAADIFHVSDDSWAETTITWDNKPAADSGSLDSISGFFYRTWVDFDLFSSGIPDTSDDLNDNYVSLVLKAQPYGLFQFASKEYIPEDGDLEYTTPYLRIDYTEHQVVPEPATMALFGIGSAMMAFIRKKKTV